MFTIYMFTICSLYIHYMFTICSLYVHYMFTNGYPLFIVMIAKVFLLMARHTLMIIQNYCKNTLVC